MIESVRVRGDFIGECMWGVDVWELEIKGGCRKKRGMVWKSTTDVGENALVGVGTLWVKLCGRNREWERMGVAEVRWVGRA